MASCQRLAQVGAQLLRRPQRAFGDAREAEETVIERRVFAQPHRHARGAQAFGVRKVVFVEKVVLTHADDGRRQAAVAGCQRR